MRLFLRSFLVCSMHIVIASVVNGNPATILLEAESFETHGGWKLDTQFIEEMGSPYLLAHGLGAPVADAFTRFDLDSSGTYHVWVRTKDWVARWHAQGSPGKFHVSFNDKQLETDFGTDGAEWHWQYGGTVQAKKGPNSIRLIDGSGFDGRCDCIALTAQKVSPPNASSVLPPWRKDLLDISKSPATHGPYDLVVIGGGYAGIGASVSAARMGLKVALLQNRPVLGGNGSSEVRVWAKGLIRRGTYPRIGEIIEEFRDNAKKSPGTYEEFGDSKKESFVRSEDNIDLFLNMHAFAVETDNSQSHIDNVTAFDTRTNQIHVFRGTLFCDSTGHATIAHKAGAETVMEPTGRMGMSNMWTWAETPEPQVFPETPWALPLTMADFPYPRDHHGQWFWESGFDKDPLNDAEGIRDWNLRAVYGAFSAMKNGDGALNHSNAALTWVAYVGGPRESRRILGDVVLTQDDIVSKRQFPDGCVASTWSIDLHYPKEQYAKKFPDNPFISIAVHDRRIDRSFGYPVPYRCFYSRNVNNLFMTGRCISVTHQALGTTRVMQTCGMMGEVVGKAASVAIRNKCNPRSVYKDYWSELADLLQLPGKAHRKTPTAPLEIPTNILPLAGPTGEPLGVDPVKLAQQFSATVLDDRDATFQGKWQKGHGLDNYIGNGYRYASAETNATATFTFRAPAADTYEILVAWQPHANRGNTVPVSVLSENLDITSRINMKQAPTINKTFGTAGHVSLKKGERCTVTIGTHSAGGLAHADAVMLVPKK